MIETVSRRTFIFAGLGLGVAHLVMRKHQATPKIYKLTQWSSVPEFHAIQQAFQYLESAAVENQAPGRYAIDGEKLYATIVEDKTRAVDTAQFEEHRRFIDIHYLVRGEELIGSAQTTSLRIAKPYSPEVEAAMYERPESFTHLILKPGDFTVFFPGQPHMPGCFVEKSAEIRKIVIKILASSV